MSTKELLDEAMKLKPEERFTLVEGLIKSIDEPEVSGLAGIPCSEHML